MLKLIALVCCVGVAASAPSVVTKSKEEVDNFLKYLERAKPHDDNRLLEDAMAENPKASAWENSGKYQGDILLNDEQIENLAGNFEGSRSALVWQNVRWPANTVIWEFAAGHMNNAQRDSVIRAIQEIERYTCVRFRQRTNEANFVRVTNWQDGCYAHVGYWSSFGVHTLNLANGCFNHFIIIHEWMHVVGLMHMHQTYRRYNYIWINWDNVQPGTQSEFELHPASEVTMLGTPYEYASNLHYGPYAFSRNGQRTIGNRFNDYGQMGQLNFVTGWDWTRVNRMYNCPGAWNRGLHDEELAQTQPEEWQLQVEDVEPAAEDVLV